MFIGVNLFLNAQKTHIGKTFIKTKPNCDTRQINFKLVIFEWSIAHLTQSTAVWPGEGAYEIWNTLSNCTPRGVFIVLLALESMRPLSIE